MLNLSNLNSFLLIFSKDYFPLENQFTFEDTQFATLIVNVYFIMGIFLSGTVIIIFMYRLNIQKFIYDNCKLFYQWIFEVFEIIYLYCKINKWLFFEKVDVVTKTIFFKFVNFCKVLIHKFKMNLIIVYNFFKFSLLFIYLILLELFKLYIYFKSGLKLLYITGWLKWVFSITIIFSLFTVNFTNYRLVSINYELICVYLLLFNFCLILILFFKPNYMSYFIKIYLFVIGVILFKFILWDFVTVQNGFKFVNPDYFLEYKGRSNYGFFIIEQAVTKEMVELFLDKVNLSYIVPDHFFDIYQIMYGEKYFYTDVDSLLSKYISEWEWNKVDWWIALILFVFILYIG